MCFFFFPSCSNIDRLHLLSYFFSLHSWSSYHWYFWSPSSSCFAKHAFIWNSVILSLWLGSTSLARMLRTPQCFPRGTWYQRAWSFGDVSFDHLVRTVLAKPTTNPLHFPCIINKKFAWDPVRILLAQIFCPWWFLLESVITVVVVKWWFSIICSAFIRWYSILKSFPQHSH